MTINFIKQILCEATTPTGADFSNPYILSSVIFILLGVMGPCLVWFIRNFLRIVMKKNYEIFNRSLKWVCLAGLILAIIGIILIVLTTTGAVVYEK